MREPDVSVIVVNWNGARWLPGCLASLRGQRGIRHETIVVDNASTDGSRALVLDAFPEVRLVALDENRGFAGGNNAGARVAAGRFLAFLNNDTKADPGWLQALVAALEADPRAALAASRIVFLDRPDVVDSAGDEWLRVGTAHKRGHGTAAEGWTEPAEVFGACGAACMISRARFEALGGFDEDLFLVFEDVDLSFRARLAGWTCRYVPEALVKHAGSATLGRVSAMSVFYGQRNVEWVYAANTPAALLWRTLPAHLAYEAAAAAYFLARGQFPAFVRAKLAALGGLRRVMRKRAQHQPRAGNHAGLWRAMTPGWVGTKWLEKRLGAVPAR